MAMKDNDGLIILALSCIYLCSSFAMPHHHQRDKSEHSRDISEIFHDCEQARVTLTQI